MGIPNAVMIHFQDVADHLTVPNIVIPSNHPFAVFAVECTVCHPSRLHNPKEAEKTNQEKRKPREKTEKIKPRREKKNRMR